MSAEIAVRRGLLVSACDRDGACEVECREVPPLENCCRMQALAALAILVAERDALCAMVSEAEREG